MRDRWVLMWFGNKILLVNKYFYRNDSNLMSTNEKSKNLFSKTNIFFLMRTVAILKVHRKQMQVKNEIDKTSKLITLFEFNGQGWYAYNREPFQNQIQNKGEARCFKAVWCKIDAFCKMHILNILITFIFIQVFLILVWNVINKLNMQNTLN